MTFKFLKCSDSDSVPDKGFVRDLNGTVPAPVALPQYHPILVAQYESLIQTLAVFYEFNWGRPLLGLRESLRFE